MLLYEGARANEWELAARTLRRLAQSVKAVRRETVGDSSDVDRLQAEVEILSRAVATDDRTGTMRAANEVTLIAANLSDPYAPLVPTDVDRLDYYGRAIQVSAEEGKLTELRTLQGDVRKTWMQVRPKVEVRDAGESAQRFDAVVAELEAAHSAAAYAHAATAELAATSELEEAFEGDSRAR